MRRYMTFDGASCEELGLTLLRDSVVWTPAPHKGGYIDIPGGSEPVNFSEFVSGHAEYAVGGDGEGASFVASPPLLNQADTLANRWAVIRAVKRLLHGKTVELSDSYHPEYSVSAVCSVEVDEQREYSLVKLTWEREPIRLMEPGAIEVPVAWEQAEFDPNDSTMLLLGSHPDVDTSLCGWDYAEVAERPRMASPRHPDVSSVCVYAPWGLEGNRESDVDAFTYYPSKGVNYIVYSVDDLVAEDMEKPYMRMKCNQVATSELDDADYAAFREHVGADAYVDATGWNGWPGMDGEGYATSALSDSDRDGRIDGMAGDYEFAQLKKLKEGHVRPRVGHEDPDAFESLSRAIGGDLAAYVLAEYAPAYGDAFFDYSGYYKWVEPGERPFPGDYGTWPDLDGGWDGLGDAAWDALDPGRTWVSRSHGMVAVPGPWLLSDPSARPELADLPIYSLAWRYRPVDEEYVYVDGVDGTVLAVESADTVDGESGGFATGIRYYLGESSDGEARFPADGLMEASYDIDELIDQYGTRLNWYTSGVVRLMSEVGADTCVIPAVGPIQRKANLFEPYRMVVGEVVPWNRHEGCYVWDGGSMRPSEEGDAFERGRVFEGGPDTGDEATRQDSWDPVTLPLRPVHLEFAEVYGRTAGGARGLFYVADQWEAGRVFTASESGPQRVPAGLDPTYAPGTFRATFPAYDAEFEEEVDTGYPFCIRVSSTHPATVSKDGLTCSVAGGTVQTDLPMAAGRNSVRVRVPYAEVADRDGAPAAPSVSLSWKRGDA